MTDLVIWDNARRAVEEARSIDEIKDIRDKAEALRLYSKQAGESLEVQNAVAEIKIRAERRAGELLAEMNLQHGGHAMKARSQPDTEVPPTLAELGISKSQSSRWQQIATISEPAFEQHIVATKAAGDELTTAGVLRVAKASRQPAPKQQNGKDLSPLMTSSSFEWYTPAHIIERVRQVLGDILLDPCSSAQANQVVGAERYLILEDDGLAQRWWAETVYMNPPYGEAIAAWVDKLVEEYRADYIAEAIALLPARTDTGWFKKLRVFPRCFLWGRLKFGGPGNRDNAAPFPSVVVALGCDVGAFYDAFSDIGDVYLWMGEADYDA